MFILALTIVSLCIFSTAAMYSPKGDVIVANDKNFKEEVLKSSGIVIVEFFAPWCGHCKSLVPEYEKLASTLKGVVKVVAVDATESPSLQNKYKVEGFPSLKIFGQDKKSPVDYQGQRTADAMISECMKAANKLVKDRKKGPASPKSTQPPATAAGGESKARGIHIFNANI
jgi:protein disulfide-isomerase A6